MKDDNLKLYKDQKNSIYKLQKEANTGHYTLYRYAKGERNIKNISAELLTKIAELENVDPEKLYEEMIKYQEKYGVDK